MTGLLLLVGLIVGLWLGVSLAVGLLGLAIVRVFPRWAQERRLRRMLGD